VTRADRAPLRPRVTLQFELLPGTAAELVVVRLMSQYEDLRALGAEITEVGIELPPT
jgi:hypothetical protein